MPKRSDPTIKQHKITFRPIEPPDDLPNYDNWSRVCVPVPAPFIPYILNLLRVYLWQGRWDAEPATAALAVQAWNDLVHQFVIAGECENMIILRQKPSNNCILEQSHDGGLTWSTAFNYSLCKPKMSYTEINNSYSETTTIYNDILNRYDGTATSIMPFAGATDAATRDSLCFAVRISISGYADYLVSLKKADAQERDYGNSLASAGLVASGTALSSMASLAVLAGASAVAIPLGLAALGFGLSSLVSVFVRGAMGLTDLSVYEDQAAWDELACIMYQGLKDRPINQLTFSESISSQTPESENARILQSQIQPIFDSFEIYLTFLESWANAREFFVLSPNVWDCPCEDDAATWSHTFDFTLSSAGWRTVDGGTSRAEYVAGQGWRRGVSTQSRWDVELSNAITTTITSVSATYNRQNYVLPSSESGLAVAIGTGSGGTFQYTVYSGAVALLNWSNTTELIISNNRLQLRGFTAGGFSIAFPSDLYLTSVTLTGIGVNPFA